jgi:hypothetical protein
MPLDTPLTSFRTQRVHSKITVTRTSLPLAMNLLWIFDLFNSSIFDSKGRIRKEGKQIEITNLKSNYKRKIKVHSK